MIGPDELWRLRIASNGFVGNMALLRMYWSLVLNRKLTDEEVKEGLEKLNAETK